MKLFTVSASVILLAATAVSSAQVSGEKIFRGYLLATSDSRVIAKAQSSISFDATRAMFDKTFPSERFRVLPWGEDRFLVVDLTNGPLGKLRDEMLVTRAFLDKRGSDGTIDVSRLTPEENRAAQEALGGSWMSVPGSSPQSPAFVGMNRFVLVELQMGGQKRTVHLPMSAVHPDNSFENLKKRFNPQKSSTPVSEDPARRDETLLFYGGSARKAAPEGTLAYAKALEQLQKELATRNANMALDLLRQLGEKPIDNADKTHLPSEMPDDLRNALGNFLATLWQRSGFSSQEEAQSFLLNGDGYRASTEFGIVQLLDPGDPSHHRPGASGGGKFTSVPGYYP